MWRNTSLEILKCSKEDLQYFRRETSKKVFKNEVFVGLALPLTKQVATVSVWRVSCFWKAIPYFDILNNECYIIAYECSLLGGWVLKCPASYEHTPGVVMYMCVTSHLNIPRHGQKIGGSPTLVSRHKIQLYFFGQFRTGSKWALQNPGTPKSRFGLFANICEIQIFWWFL